MGASQFAHLISFFFGSLVAFWGMPSLPPSLNAPYVRLSIWVLLFANGAYYFAASWFIEFDTTFSSELKRWRIPQHPNTNSVGWCKSGLLRIWAWARGRVEWALRITICAILYLCWLMLSAPSTGLIRVCWAFIVIYLLCLSWDVVVFRLMKCNVAYKIVGLLDLIALGLSIVLLLLCSDFSSKASSLPDIAVGMCIAGIAVAEIVLVLWLLSAKAKKKNGEVQKRKRNGKNIDVRVWRVIWDQLKINSFR